jgi:hypothetical protein
MTLSACPFIVGLITNVQMLSFISQARNEVNIKKKSKWEQGVAFALTGAGTGKPGFLRWQPVSCYPQRKVDTDRRVSR